MAAHAQRRGAHRRKRPRRALPGLPARAGCPVGSGRHRRRQRDPFSLLVAEESASFRALHEAERGLFRSLCTGSHYFHTPQAGGKVDKDNPT